MNQFSEEIKLFSEADRRLEAYPSKLQDLIVHLKKFFELGEPLVEGANAPIWHPNDVDSVRQVMAFFQDQGLDHLNLISINYKKSLGICNVNEAFYIISGIGGIHRAWHDYLADIYQSDIFPSPASYLHDIRLNIYKIFQVYEGPREKEFVRYLREVKNPWIKYAHI
ncbi:hypothetical protein [Thalassospira sp. TSL5-1]|uniref:hypothetical protein n=1 Tax=Thalassospira sp. TSL5-1 TaxID=1544451 RepID=UPI00093BBAC2|nr:hypothetical protein [Thalassospira sp. TSL5-1]OKH90124.1 hypothetical protein LF95_09655 [Thalassospira sp. TSL5-1]